jgi:hypothetical protein
MAFASAWRSDYERLRVSMRRLIQHRARRTPRSCRFTPWTGEFGPSPIGVQEPRARSQTTRSALIRGIPVYVVDHKEAVARQRPGELLKLSIRCISGTKRHRCSMSRVSRARCEGGAYH